MTRGSEYTSASSRAQPLQSGEAVKSSRSGFLRLWASSTARSTSCVQVIACVAVAIGFPPLPLGTSTGTCNDDTKSKSREVEKWRSGEVEPLRTERCGEHDEILIACTPSVLQERLGDRFNSGEQL